MKKKQRAERRRSIARAMDMQWESLRSHLAAAVDVKDKSGNEEWQARCVREYAYTINVLAIELHELARKDFKRKHEASRDKI
jgi:hypothetical protein